jgi:hypothetical protein
MYVMPGDRGNLELTERRAQIPLNDAFKCGDGDRSVLLLDMLGDVAIEQVIDCRCRTERLPFAGWVAAVDDSLKNLPRLGARAVDGDLAVLADGEPP